ncbi:MAG: hypothetical protein HQK87_00615 [Nitrospinae bacterium]|nr:hypothetical protein [Nitrospinota bacterium]
MENIEMEKDTVLVIGSGATVGSGVTRDGERLPTDSGFFESPIVYGLLGEQGYPLLNIFREFIPATEHCSLCKTWNALFNLRGLVRAGVVRLDQKIVDTFHKLGNHEWPQRYIFQQGHYSIPHTLHDYYIVECAIWELRVLFHDVYDPHHLKLYGSKYPTFWKGIERHISAVVNMNFDTTFDHGFGAHWYYPGDGVPVDGAMEIIRPHGSLGWTSLSKGCGSYDDWHWENTYEKTEFDELGFQRKGTTGPFDFRQAMIVPQPPGKEEVIGNSTVPGLGNQVLRKQWIAFERALRDSKRWVFVGFSMASGDDYLELLFRHCVSKETRIACSSYGGDYSLRNRLIETLRDENPDISCFPIFDSLRAPNLNRWLDE